MYTLIFQSQKFGVLLHIMDEVVDCTPKIIAAAYFLSQDHFQGMPVALARRQAGSAYIPAVK
jgi:hypothetical protein